MFCTFIFAVLLLKYCFPTVDQLQSSTQCDGLNYRSACDSRRNKKNVFKALLNELTESTQRRSISAGKWFQALDLATANDQTPKYVTVGHRAACCQLMTQIGEVRRRKSTSTKVTCR